MPPLQQRGTTSSAESSLALTVKLQHTKITFPNGNVQKYNAVTNQVTVTYIMQSPKNVLDTQWHISYDPSILSVADVNTAKSVCPTMDGRGVYVNFKNKSEGVGYVRFGASNLGLYDFSEKTLFATVVFDVKDISKVAPVSTTVDLVVEVLRVSEVNPDTEMTDGSKEVILVDKEVVKKDPVAVAAKNNLSTELTPSTYAEPTTAEHSTAESSTEATKATEETQESTKDTIAPVTSQDATSVTKKISSTSDTPDTSDNSGGNDGVVQTGEAPLAVVILTLLIGSTCVMFVLRKKEEIL